MKQNIGSLSVVIVMIISVGFAGDIYCQGDAHFKLASDRYVSPETVRTPERQIHFFESSVNKRIPSNSYTLATERHRPLRFPRQYNADNGWQFSVAPYLYASGISGTVGARGRTIGINASFGDVWKKLDVPLMVVTEARNRRFFSLTDLVWVKLSDERDTPGEVYSTRKIGVNLFAFDPEVGYRLVEGRKSTFDVLGGVSIWSVETNINVTTGRLPGFDVSMRKTWASPVVGVRGNYDLTSKFFVSGRFEIGGAGIGADLATKFYGGVGYRLSRSTALAGGYRLLQVDYDDHNGFLFDTRMNGLVLGAKLSF